MEQTKANRFRFRAWCDIEDDCDCGMHDNLDAPIRDGGWINMQSTGLCDKNGVEIFEGDLVECVALANDQGQRGATSVTVVRWFAGNMCLCFAGHESGVPMFPFNVTHTLTLIGNIYEHPQLLSPKSVPNQATGVATDGGTE